MVNQASNRTVWKLRKGLDRRFRAGHPWVYSNELLESPQGIEPGSAVELRDASGRFLARGYGNPKSLIAFRAISRDEENRDPLSSTFILEKLKQAWRLRVSLGLGQVSARVCYGEADGLPGLIIDRYVLEAGQVWVVQAHTAGADRWVPSLLEILKAWGEEDQNLIFPWEKTAVVLRNDISVRKLEGLLEEAPRLLKEGTHPSLLESSLREAKIKVSAVMGNIPLVFQVNLVEGQKTGFFLDQFANIQLAALRFQRFFATSGMSQIRILDLCCYVGQWGTQLARVFQESGLKVHVVAVDASAQALAFAKQNIMNQEIQGTQAVQGAQGIQGTQGIQRVSCETWKADVLKDLGQISDQSFDIVISDPPALIKSRKDIPTGTHAYLQLATQVFRIVKKGGGVVCCSCSALLEEESFLEALSKGARRNSAQVSWVGRGAQSPDHPMWLEFPEGRYLKGWIGISR